MESHLGFGEADAAFHFLHEFLGLMISLDLGNQFAVLAVPKLHCIIHSSGGESFASRTDRDCCDLPAMIHLPNLLLIFQIPEADGAIFTAGEKLLSPTGQ